MKIPNPKLYFDAAASTPLLPEVKTTMIEAMDFVGNNNSKHVFGQGPADSIRKNLETIARVLNVSPDQIFPTSSATDANRRFLWAASKRTGLVNLWGSGVEHSSVRDEVLSSNVFDPRDISQIPASAKTIALMASNSETGEIYPAGALREKFPDAQILRDYSQSFAKFQMPDFANADAGTFAPHKFYGPIGIGCIYLRNPQDYPEISKDTHTKNPALIAGMAKAFECWERDKSVNEEKINRWTNQIENTIRDSFKPVDFVIHGADQSRVSGVINVAFRGIRGPELMTKLSKLESIAVSTGSACTSDLLTPTPVIQFIQPDPEFQFPIRISLHSFLDDEAVSDFCDILVHYVSEGLG